MKQLTYEIFEKCIQSIIDQDEYMGKLYDVGLDLYENNGMKTENCLLDLLEYLTNDNNDTISYWLYDCECGKCGENKIQINGRYVPFTTIKDLWNVLNYKDKKKEEE